MITHSDDGHIYCLDTAGAVDNDYSYYPLGTSAYYPSTNASLAVSDFDDDSKVEIFRGKESHQMVDNNDYSCYPGAIKWGMFGAGTKHNGNGDNRFAILIQGSKGTNAFERGQYKGHNEQKKNDKESSIANYWIYILIIIVIIILMIILYY